MRGVVGTIRRHRRMGEAQYPRTHSHENGFEPAVFSALVVAYYRLLPLAPFIACTVSPSLCFCFFLHSLFAGYTGGLGYKHLKAKTVNDNDGRRVVYCITRLRAVG